MSDNLKELSIGAIFQPITDEKLSSYIIPRYQRNYAWKQAQVVQLIQDIYDFSSSNNLKNQNYYIGTLVVYERKKNGEITYETIDGQQRLTTLNILFSVLKNEFNDVSTNFKINLSFDSRPLSSYTLEHIFEKPNEDINTSEKKLNTRIIDAYKTIKKELQKIEKENQLKYFTEYLKNNVVLLRAPVPHDTNLNHYFEIMNNRGEQLEKHEVLKAQMLKVFQKDAKSTKVFATIWEACANMEKYVQYGFDTDVRSVLFGKDWNHFSFNDFNGILNCFKDVNVNDDKNPNIFEILKDHKVINSETKIKEDAPEQFTSIINFSNFLLHILRILLNKSDKYIANKDVPLDDKRLLDTFKPFVNNKDFVEDFAHLLLKGKHFYDKYIIKRNLKTEKWSLKFLKGVDKKPRYLNSFGLDDEDNYGFNKQSLMLLSMFHFSAPTLVYKHWLNAALNYVLDDNFDNNGEDYINYLEQLSDAYLYDNYLAVKEYSFYDIIYKNKAKTKNQALKINNLHTGTQVENFIFNRLDYLIWKKDRELNEKKYNDFYFSPRTSVEHYYPQNPIQEEDRLDNLDILNNFGNLCLISSSKNSRLSNFTPQNKKEFYKKSEIKESLKQQIMMNYDTWDSKQILEHGKKMIQILIKPTNATKVLSLKSRKTELQWNFWQSLEAKLVSKGIKLLEDKKVALKNVKSFYHDDNNPDIYYGFWVKIYEKENISIHFGIEIDHSIYFGFTIERNGNGGIALNEENVDYRNLVLDINNNYKTSNGWLGWRHTEEKLNFRAFNSQAIFELEDRKKLDKKTDKIATDILNDINQLKTKLEKI